MQGSIRNNFFISSNECHKREDFIKAEKINFIYYNYNRVFILNHYKTDFMIKLTSPIRNI